MKKFILLSVLVNTNTRNLSLSGLSRKAGLAPNYLCSKINDCFNWNPLVDNLLNISAALAIKPADLIRMSGEIQACKPLTPCIRTKLEVKPERRIRHTDIYSILKKHGKEKSPGLTNFIGNMKKTNPRTTLLQLCDVAEKTGFKLTILLEEL